MDAFTVATFGAAAVVTAIGLSGDIAGACDAIGGLIIGEHEPSPINPDYLDYQAIEQYGTEWDQVDSGWWK